MKKQVMFAVIFAGCIFQVGAKKVNNEKHVQAIYDTNMALLTAYEAQAAGLGGKKEELKSRLKMAKNDQKRNVASATDAQKQQALLNLKNAQTPEMREAAEKTLAQLYGVKNSDRVDSIFKKMSDLEKTITDNNRKISAVYKKAKDAALVLDGLNGNSDMIDKFNNSRQTSYVTKITQGQNSDKTPQYRFSGTMADAGDLLEEIKYYEKQEDAKRAQKALKKADAALEAQQEKVQAQKATTNQKKKGKGKRAASSSNNQVVLMDQGGRHGGFYEAKPNKKWK